MGTGDDRVEARVGELARSIQAASAATASPIDAASAIAIVRQFAVITPAEDPPLQLITVSSNWSDRGSSFKPGNIRLDMRKLTTAIANGVLIVVGTPHVPWIAFFGALAIWDSLHSLMKLELSERDACVIWVLWTMRDDNDSVPHEGLLEEINRRRRSKGIDPISASALDGSLRTLERMKCIERSRSDHSRWWLREWVQVRD